MTRRRLTSRPEPTLFAPDDRPIQWVGRNGQPLKHPRADWLTDPASFGVPPYVTEHRFHPTRRWRFDFAWPDHRVAIEIDGASGSYGRHSRPGGMRADHEKLNTAAVMGWRVLRVLRGEEIRLTTLDLLLAALRATDVQEVAS
jgi:hypothetical protein